LDDCWALRRGQIHEVLDPKVGLMCRHFVHIPETGYLCVPLTVQGETLGMLCLINNTSAQKKSEHQANQQQLATMVGEAVKLSISNLRLREQLRERATRDPLTGLFNRRYLDETLPRELRQAKRRKAPLCIVMLDLDHFKEFNDSFGHGPGDALLREFGRVLRENLRDGDISCRYGGDEFVIVLPDSSMADTLQRIEEIGAFVQKLQVHYGEHLLGRVTLSAGIAQSHDNTNASELLREADEALYTAKQTGRGRISIYEPKK
jgi:diguanylate cyclase (GGDEF)-like protein